MADGYTSSEQIVLEDGGVMIEEDGVFTAPVRLSFQQHNTTAAATRHRSEIYTRAPPNRNLSVPARANSTAVVTRRSLSRHGSKVQENKREDENTDEVEGAYLLSTLLSTEAKKRYKDYVAKSRQRLKDHEHLTKKFKMPKTTEAFTSALKLLEMFTPVMITGVIGSGKTHVALDLLVTMLEGTYEYEPVILNSTRDLDIILNTPSPIALLIDDCLGHAGVCHRTICELRRYFTPLKRLLLKRKLLLVFTAENERLEQLPRDITLFDDLQCKQIDLCSNEFLLDDVTRQDILNSWIGKLRKNDADPDGLRSLDGVAISDDIGFPGLCQLVRTVDFPAVFEQPLDAIDSTITQWEKENPHMYALLVLIVTRANIDGHFQLKELESHLEHMQEVVNHYDWKENHSVIIAAKEELKTMGVIHEPIGGAVVISSRLVHNRVLQLFLERQDIKCLRALSISALSHICYCESDSDYQPEPYKPTFELSSKLSRTIAANINNALETEAISVYREIAAMDIWTLDSFLEIIVKLYGHHLFFITDTSQTCLLVYLIRATQQDSIYYILNHVNENPNLFVALSAQIESSKIEAVFCDNMELFQCLFNISPEITNPLVDAIVECDNVVLLESLCDKFNLQSDASVFRNASKFGSFNVLRYQSNAMNAKLMSSEIRKRGQDGQSPLHLAAASGNIDVFEWLQNLGADIKTKTGSGFNVAHICAMYGHLDLLMHVHELNQDLINMKAEHDFQCIHLAAMEGHIDILMYLVEKISNPDVVAEDENTVSHIAAVNGRNNVLQLLIVDFREQMFKPNAHTFLPPHLAAKFGQTDTIKFFFRHGVDTELMTEDCRSLLHLAAFDGHLDTVKYFCDNHTSLCKLCDIDGNTVLHDAAAGGNMDVFLELLQHGADPTRANDDGATVLHDAAFYGRFDIVKHVCSQYSDLIHTTSRSGLTPAIGAALGGHVDIIEYLEMKGADLNVQTQEGSTALHEAAYAGELDMVKHLCGRFPAMQETRNKRSFLPFHFAAQEGHLDVLRYLLSDLIGPTGMLPITEGCQTILHISTYNGMMDVIKYIVTKFPTLLPCKDTEGAVALHYAARGGSIEALDYLIENGLDPRIVTDSGSTILHLAAFDGNYDMVIHICDMYPDLVNNQDKSGHTAAHYAAGSGEIPVLLSILKYGVDPMIRAENGSTLLMKAAGSGKVAMVQYLCSEYPDMTPLKDQCGCDMLHYAACGGSVDAVKIGINKGLDPMTISAEEHSLLHVATFHNRLNVVMFLSEYYPEMLKLEDAYHKTPVDMADELGLGSISRFYKHKTEPQSTITGKTEDSVEDNGGALADVLCCAGQVKCRGCKSIWGAIVSMLCFCRQ